MSLSFELAVHDPRSAKLANPFDNAVQIGRDFVSVNAQRLNVFALQKRISRSVALDFVIVKSAVNFYAKLCASAVKIESVRADWELTSNPKAHGIIFETRPQNRLRF